MASTVYQLNVGYCARKKKFQGNTLFAQKNEAYIWEN